MNIIPLDISIGKSECLSAQKANQHSIERAFAIFHTYAYAASDYILWPHPGLLCACVILTHSLHVDVVHIIRTRHTQIYLCERQCVYIFAHVVRQNT